MQETSRIFVYIASSLSCGRKGGGCWMASKTEPLWREFASKFEPPHSQILPKFWAKTSNTQLSSNNTFDEQRSNLRLCLFKSIYWAKPSLSLLAVASMCVSNSPSLTVRSSVPWVIKIVTHVDLSFETEPLINRNPGSSKNHINQQLTGKNNRRVIFRVIERKL